MSNLSDDESMYSAAATVANSDIIPVVARARASFQPEETEEDANEDEFEPTVEMMVHDFDDEKTIEEEEKRALEENSTFQEEEVKSLQKESEMPLEELLKMYSAPPPIPIEKTKSRKRKPEDAEFEPTVEMMVHDFDDEKTIEEEEKRALEDNESFQHEVESLQKESEMPLEELMKMYSTPIPETSVRKKKSKVNSAIQRSKKARKRAAAAAASSSNVVDVSEDKGDSVGPVSSTTNIPEPELHTEEEEENPSLLATITVEEDVEDEEDDGDYSPEIQDTEDPDDDDTKKVKIGFDYQANIPDGLCKYDDVLPYNNEDKLVWCPFAIDDKAIENYLDNYREIDKIQQQQLENEKKENEKKKKNGGESPSEEKNLPTSTTEDVLETVQLTYDSSKHQHLRSSTSNLRDDEQALYLLLQCGFNFEEALRRKKVNNVCCSFPFSSPMSSWSEEECRSFENGMRLNGKNFYIIAKTKTTTRSVSEICEFYYNWKKTTRYDAFVSKQNGNGSGEDKKSVNNFRKSNASVTDYMDKFLDEDSSASDTFLNANGGDGPEKNTINLRKRRGSSVNSATSENHNETRHLKGSRSSGRTLLPKK